MRSACRAPGPASGPGLGSSTAVKQSPPKGVEAPAIAAPERAVKYPPSSVASPAFTPKPVEGLMNTPGLNGLTAGGISGLQTVRAVLDMPLDRAAPRIFESSQADSDCCSAFASSCSHGSFARQGAAAHTTSHSLHLSLSRLCLLTCPPCLSAGLFPGGGGAAGQLHHQRGFWPAGSRQRGVSCTCQPDAFEQTLLMQGLIDGSERWMSAALHLHCVLLPGAATPSRMLTHRIVAAGRLC